MHVLHVHLWMYVCMLVSLFYFAYLYVCILVCVYVRMQVGT